MEARNRYTEKVDVWSIGFVMYAVLANDFPFNGENEILNKKLKFNRYQGHGVTQEAKQLVRSMLERDPVVRRSVTTLRQDQEIIEKTHGVILCNKTSKFTHQYPKTDNTQIEFFE